ncbi:kinase-like domain-containing protein [Rhizophagus clarus]|uniref:Kinase-like domain-containing protein n=1 Tax=Rhizophagus clarus TaxID=94130 RepID=A0A8H3QXZ6_9GLOM|nr:kinase-like domain-containing protein [Rhizophagus clarus]
MSYLDDDDKCNDCDKQYKSKYDAKYKWCKPCQINNIKQNFTNWTSGNERIDNLIQEIQSEINELDDMIFEWIPCDQFDVIKEIGEGPNKVYLAIWKVGPLNYDKYKNEYVRNQQNIKVALKFYNLENITDEFFIDQDKKYSVPYISEVLRMYGISQCPNTKDYIIVFQDIYCEKCGKKYTNMIREWCESCQIYYFKKTSASSGNEQIDNIIHEMQLKINYKSDIVFEWIQYDQLSDIQEISKNDFEMMYSAIWKDGPLFYNDRRWTRKSDKAVTLKYLYNSQNIIKFLNKIKFNKHPNLYGISQNSKTGDYIMVFPNIYCKKCSKQYKCKDDANYEWCKICKINNLKQNFINWSSGNAKIDNLIQEMQLEINKSDDIIFEWIPYNQLDDIKEEIFTKEYSALWKDGPLNYNKIENRYIRNKRNTKVALKLYNCGNIIDDFLNEVKEDLSEYYGKILGISQDPYTRNYIMILQNEYNEKCNKCDENYITINPNWCRQCYTNCLKTFFINWTSGNKRIDNFIQKMQTKISEYDDTILEFIPYNQFNNINEIEDDGSTIIYSAIWKDGPLLHYDKKWTRESNQKIYFKSYSLQDTDEFLDEVEEYLSESGDLIYGISQNPDTEHYIIVITYKLFCKRCGEEQCSIYNDKYECIECQENDIKSNFANWTSENDKIDNLIQKMQLEINRVDDNREFEWIPYNQFNNIKKINNDSTIYLAVWNNDFLYYDNFYEKEQLRRLKLMVTLKYTQNIIDEVEKGSISKKYGISQDPNTKDYIIVFENEYCEKSIWKDGPLTYNGYEYIRDKKKIALKQLDDSQNISIKFLNEVKKYSIYNFDEILSIYGISQNPDTKDFIMVLDYAKGGNLYNWVNKYYNKLDWSYNIYVLRTTRRQPFANKAHDESLVLDICEGIRPDINDQEAPECYIDLMKRCWDLNPDNRPKANEIYDLFQLFHDSYTPDSDLYEGKEQQHYDIEKQFRKVDEYKESNFLILEEGKQSATHPTHPQAVYISRLLNLYTECLDCAI